MRVLLTTATACVLALALAGTAFAHGGAYRGGGPQASGPAVPPGPADRPAPTTTWETWWSMNKDSLLRLRERMREDGAAVTPGNDGTQVERRAKRDREDALTREAMLPVFLEALGDPSFEVRTAAAVALGKLGDDRASDALRKAARDDTHGDVRDAALLGVGMLGAERDVPWLLDILSDGKENTRHRSFAAFGLGMIGGDDAAALLLRFAEKSRREAPQLVSSVYVALGLTDCALVLPEVRDGAANHDDDNVRAFAILALGRLQDTTSIADAATWLRKEPQSNVRRSAAITLGKIAGPKDKAAVDALFRALDDSDPLTRHFAAVALGGVSDAAIRKKLIHEFPGAPRLDRPFYALALALAGAVEAAPMIRQAVRDERDENLRGGYCIALGVLDDAGAVDLLREQAKERGEIWLPGYAALALGMIGSREAAPQLRERLAGEHDPRLRMNIAVALGMLHDPRAREFLVATVRDPKGTLYERGSAAMALGVLRLNSAADDLLAVYRDTKEQELVRAMAIVALGVLADPSPTPKLARFAADHNYGVATDPLNEVLSIL